MRRGLPDPQPTQPKLAVVQAARRLVRGVRPLDCRCRGPPRLHRRGRLTTNAQRSGKSRKVSRNGVQKARQPIDQGAKRSDNSEQTACETSSINGQHSEQHSEQSRTGRMGLLSQLSHCRHRWAAAARVRVAEATQRDLRQRCRLLRRALALRARCLAAAFRQRRCNHTEPVQNEAEITRPTADCW